MSGREQLPDYYHSPLHCVGYVTRKFALYADSIEQEGIFIYPAKGLMLKEEQDRWENPFCLPTCLQRE